MREAEKDEHIAAPKIPIGHLLPMLIDEGERAADQRLAGGRHVRIRCGSGEDECGGTRQRSDEEAGDNDG
jgi:hypothetical protein